MDYRLNIGLFANSFGLQNLTVVGRLLGWHNPLHLPFHHPLVAVFFLLAKFLLSKLPFVLLYL